MAELTEKQLEILAAARQHDGRYLLPKRFSRNLVPDERDKLYQDCQSLVDSGHARWMQGFDILAPGILLTGKPAEF